MGARVGWAEFDATGPSANVGWCEFDTQAGGYGACVGWIEFDCLSPDDQPVPIYAPRGGVSRYHSLTKSNYDIPVLVDESEEEEIIMQILMEIAAREI